MKRITLNNLVAGLIGFTALLALDWMSSRRLSVDVEMLVITPLFVVVVAAIPVLFWLATFRALPPDTTNPKTHAAIAAFSSTLIFAVVYAIFGVVFHFAIGGGL